MTYFDLIQESDHEQVVFCSDKQSGLKAIIGIHNTCLGPALGGCRMTAYSSEQEALMDVLRLSKAMTYKSAMAGLNLGGGKTVVMLEKPEDKTPELLMALAKRINALKGSYIGAGDIGSNTRDLSLMRQITPWITGLAKEDGGLGDSAILTSLGVFMGLKAAVKERFGHDDLMGVKVSLQGTGKVGYHLLQHLYKAGCQLWVSDVQEEALARVKQNFPLVSVVSSEALLEQDADIFSPNAVGGILTPEFARNIAVSIVAGGANNILATPEAGDILNQRNILYAPDFVINSGGVIMVGLEIQGGTFEEAHEQTLAVYDRVTEVFQLSKTENIPTQEAAIKLAMRRIESENNKPRKKPKGKLLSYPPGKQKPLNHSG